MLLLEGKFVEKWFLHFHNMNKKYLLQTNFYIDLKQIIKYSNVYHSPPLEI